MMAIFSSLQIMLGVLYVQVPDSVILKEKSGQVDWEGKDCFLPGREHYALEQVKKREQGKVGKD